MNLDEVLLTDLTSVSPYFRLLNNLRSRKRSIHWQSRMQKTRPKKMHEHLKNIKKMEAELNFVDMYSISSSSYKRINREFKSYESREKHMTAIFGKCLTPSKNREACPIETNMLRTMAMDNKAKRVKELQTRILLEIIEKQSKGWFMVFNTLTVADAYMKQVFNRKERIFEKYILSLNYAVKKQARINGKSDQRDTGSYHTYFAVVEEGGKTGRLHFHVLHFCKYLPPGSCDPNYGRKLSDRRIIANMRKYWAYGFSAPIAVRLDGSDNYATAGWRWPVKRSKDGNSLEAIAASNPLRLARYISKYIQKSNEEGHYRWKTRISRGFGTTLIKKAIKRLPMKILEEHLIQVAMWRHLEVMDIMMPLTTTRKLALKEYLQRKKSSKKGSKLSTIQKSLMTKKALPSIVAQLRTLTQPRLRSSSANTSCLKTKNLKRVDIFSIREAFSEELTKCGYHKKVQESRGVTWNR